MEFGKPTREKYFSLLGKDVVPLNHGSYGLLPEPVFDEFIKVMKQDYNHPDAYMFVTEGQQYQDALKVVGEIVHCNWKNLAFMDNATSGINAVFRSIKFKNTDKILCSSIVYDSCENVLLFVKEMFGVEIVKIHIDIEKDVFEQFKTAIDDNPDLTMCLFDVISSMPALLLPYKEINAYLKSKNIITVIDGAHGVGLVPLDLEELKPDYFVSNLHKWYFVPRPLAFLYVDPKHHGTIQPLPISHVYIDYDDDMTLVRKFQFLASKNYAYFNCIAKAKEFRSMWGEDQILKYKNDLRAKVSKWLVERWGTKVFGPENIALVNIKLPIDYEITADIISKVNIDAIKQKNYFQFKTYDGVSYVRLSFQIYNEFDDYKVGIQVLEKLLELHKPS